MPRNIKKISLPWLAIGAQVLNRSKMLSSVDFRFFFKLNPQLVQYAWLKLEQHPTKTTAQDFLWTLHFLKSSNQDLSEIASVLHTTKKTLMSHVSRTVQALEEILPEVCR